MCVRWRRWWGFGIGLTLAFAASRMMTGLVSGVVPTEPLAYAGVSAPLGAVALVARHVPARRATRSTESSPCP